MQFCRVGLYFQLFMSTRKVTRNFFPHVPTVMWPSPHQTLLARYRCRYDPRQGRIEEVSDPMFSTTSFASKQIALIELDDAQWKKVYQRPSRPYSRRRAKLPEQLLLIDLGASALILLALKAI